ncbi:hypothetical protein Pfo_007201, partial [Paulownia fortunei]
ICRLDIQKNCYDSIDYESIDKIDLWVMEEEEENSSLMLDIDELNNMLYGEQSLPRNIHEEEVKCKNCIIWKSFLMKVMMKIMVMKEWSTKCIFLWMKEI